MRDTTADLGLSRRAGDTTYGTPVERMLVAAICLITLWLAGVTWATFHTAHLLEVHQGEVLASDAASRAVACRVANSMGLHIDPAGPCLAPRVADLWDQGEDPVMHRQHDQINRLVCEVLRGQEMDDSVCALLGAGTAGAAE